jgi:hypothetical protein
MGWLHLDGRIGRFDSPQLKYFYFFMQKSFGATNPYACDPACPQPVGRFAVVAAEGPPCHPAAVVEMGG